MPTALRRTLLVFAAILPFLVAVPPSRAVGPYFTYMDPTEGPPGTEIGIIGSGFDDTREVRIFWDGERVATVTPHENGSWQVTITVPASAAVGNHAVRWDSTSAFTGMTSSRTESFHVTDGPPPTSTTSAPPASTTTTTSRPGPDPDRRGASATTTTRPAAGGSPSGTSHADGAAGDGGESPGAVAVVSGESVGASGTDASEEEDAAGVEALARGARSEPGEGGSSGLGAWLSFGGVAVAASGVWAVWRWRRSA